VTAAATAPQFVQRALSPGWPSAPAGGGEGSGEGVRAERRFDPVADDVEVDAEESQRLAVDPAQQIGRRAPPDSPQYLRLDACGGDAPVAQDRAGRLGGRSRGQQQVLAADVVVPKPAGILLRLGDDLAQRCR
jgi:hypothetical protein